MLQGVHSFVMAEAVFLACMTFAILMPRLGPVRDSSWFAGDLSRPFRKCVFLVTCTSMARAVLLPDRRFAVNDCVDDHCSRVSSMMQFSWTVMEGVLMAFLRMCMPYLLQRQLSAFVNVIPGKSLQAWIFAVIALDLAAIVLATTVMPQFWTLKKLGDALLGIPVIQTVNLYRRVMKAREESASFVLLDILLGLEYCRAVVGLGAAVEYALDDRDPNKDLSQLWMTMRVSNIYMSYVCTLMHGAVLAVIDEGQLMTRCSSSPPPASASTPFGDEYRDPEERLDTTLIVRDRSKGR